MSIIIGGTIFEAVQGDMEDQVAEESVEMTVIGMMLTIEVEIDQERSHSQEVIMVTELEMQATVGLGQDLELVLIGIELDAIIVESMITLQGIVPPPEKKGI